MKLKTLGQSISYCGYFDIYDARKRECNLSKAYAYLLSKDPTSLRSLLKLLKIDVGKKWSDKILKESCIEIEHAYPNARTDIEIAIKSLKLFVLIETKVHNNKATAIQFLKYLPILKKNTAGNKFFVFISEQKGIHILDENIHIIDITWREIVENLWKINAKENTVRSEFLSYFERNYGMSVQGEILIQNLKEKDEISRFENNCYRRAKVNGRPMYFSPYFTRSNQSFGRYKEGISTLSRILGVITIQDLTWEKIEDKCTSFIETFYPNDLDKKKKLLTKWEIATTINNKDNDKTYTYFFLDDYVYIKKPILKSKNSTNWINKMIPPNRCVSFDEFVKRMQQ